MTLTTSRGSPTRDGSVIARLSDQYSLTVFPFVEGAAGDWGDTVTQDFRTALLRQLVTLHQVAADAHAPIPRRSFDFASSG
jgi:spectinomycin phosphotransferase